MFHYCYYAGVWVADIYYISDSMAHWGGTWGSQLRHTLRGTVVAELFLFIDLAFLQSDFGKHLTVPYSEIL